MGGTVGVALASARAPAALPPLKTRIFSEFRADHSWEQNSANPRIFRVSFAVEMPEFPQLGTLAGQQTPRFTTPGLHVRVSSEKHYPVV